MSGHPPVRRLSVGRRAQRRLPVPVVAAAAVVVPPVVVGQVLVAVVQPAHVDAGQVVQVRVRRMVVVVHVPVVHREPVHRSGLENAVLTVNSIPRTSGLLKRWVATEFRVAISLPFKI